MGGHHDVQPAERVDGHLHETFARLELRDRIVGRYGPAAGSLDCRDDIVGGRPRRAGAIERSARVVDDN